jgi:hypothetical protein
MRDMDLHIVNPDPKDPRASLLDATTLGCFYLGASVRPPRRLPFVMPSANRARLLERLKHHAHWLNRIDAVMNATVFRAVALPPTARFSAYLKARAGAIQVADFDVLLLTQTRSPAVAEALQQTPVYSPKREDIMMNTPCEHLTAETTIEQATTGAHVKQGG